MKNAVELMDSIDDSGLADSAVKQIPRVIVGAPADSVVDESHYKEINETEIHEAAFHQYYDVQYYNVKADDSIPPRDETPPGYPREVIHCWCDSVFP